MWMYDNYRNRHPLSGRYLGYWGGRRAWWKHRGDRGGNWNGGQSHGQHHEARPPRPTRPDRPARPKRPGKWNGHDPDHDGTSEERSDGTEGVSTLLSRWSAAT